MKKLILFIFVIPVLSFGNYTGERILKAAQKYGMTDSELNYLIDNTAPDLTLKDPQTGATALIYACINNRPNMVKILAERGGANVDEVDINGETCLIAATKKGNIEVIKILTDLNANKSIVGNLNKTAYDYAIEFGHTEIARLLGGPPKQKTSFKTISKLAVDKNRQGSQGTSLEAQKYIQELGRISLIVEAMKPGQGKPGTGKTSVEKINEISKVTGFSDVVKKQMQSREVEEEKLRLEKETKRAKAHSVMMAKLKAIAAFNNLYIDVSSKKGQEPPQKVPPGGTSKLSFSDATRNLMNDMDQKLKKKEDDINKEKEADIERGATERVNTIRIIIFSGQKEKNIAALKNESTEKLKGKLDAIRDLLDVKEPQQVRSLSLQNARRKINVINAFQSGGQAYQEKMRQAEIEDQQSRNKTLIQLGEIYKRKQEESARLEEMERENFYKLVQEKAKVAKFTENMKQKSGIGQSGGAVVTEDKATGPGSGGGSGWGAVKNSENRAIAVEQTKIQETGGISGKRGFDEVRKVVATKDFLIWPLTSRDCQIKRNPSGTFYVIISKFKLSNVGPATRKDAKWFVNTKEKPTPPNGGLECGFFCKDPAIYVGSIYNNPKRELFLSNLIIQLGKGPLDSIELYSPVPGNQVIKVSISDCKMAF